MSSATDKHERRLARNRLSAQLHRERQREYVFALQRHAASMTAERNLWKEAVSRILANAAPHFPGDTAGALQSLLSGVELPVHVEKVAPLPTPPSGRSIRNPDGSDPMRALLRSSKDTVRPKGRHAARAVLDAAVARARRVLEEQARSRSALDTEAEGAGDDERDEGEDEGPLTLEDGSHAGDPPRGRPDQAPASGSAGDSLPPALSSPHDRPAVPRDLPGFLLLDPPSSKRFRPSGPAFAEALIREGLAELELLMHDEGLSGRASDATVLRGSSSLGSVPASGRGRALSAASAASLEDE